MFGSPLVFLGLLLFAGALLFVIGSLLIRAAGTERPFAEVAPVAVSPVTESPRPFVHGAFDAQLVWTRAFVDTDQPIDVPMRLEMIGRLALVGEPWCISILQIARAEESDPEVRAAISIALA